MSEREAKTPIHKTMLSRHFRPEAVQDGMMAHMTTIVVTNTVINGVNSGDTIQVRIARIIRIDKSVLRPIS